MVFVNNNINANIISKRKVFEANGDTLFYIGNDTNNNNKVFLEKPKFNCGWYYSIDNIFIYTKNMRGFVCSTHITDNESLYNLSHEVILKDCVCNIVELYNKIKEIRIETDKIKCLTNPKEIYNLIYDTIPNLFTEFECLITDTSKLRKYEIKRSYINQTLDNIKNTIKAKESIVRYMLFNEIEIFEGKPVQFHIDRLNSYRNKFVLFKLFE